jgi:D-arabinose 1-dehydrogenase-like Zn-dependent alcohol dehydrogenase
MASVRDVFEEILFTVSRQSYLASPPTAGTRKSLLLRLGPSHRYRMHLDLKRQRHLCAGMTAYNALRNTGLRAGDMIAVQAICRLGRLGIQFARQMGFHVVVLGRGTSKKRLATQLGTHIFVDTAKHNASAVLQRTGGDDAMLTYSLVQH